MSPRAYIIISSSSKKSNNKNDFGFNLYLSYPPILMRNNKKIRHGGYNNRIESI